VRTTPNERTPPKPPAPLADASFELSGIITSATAVSARLESILVFSMVISLIPSRAPSLFDDQRLTGGCARQM
jgi:hypothetical protein